MERPHDSTPTSEETPTEAASSDGLAIALREARMQAQKEAEERAHLERVLRDSQSRLHALFDRSLIGFFQATLDGQLLAANPALLRMLGFSSFEEMSAFHVDLPSQARPEIRERLQADGKLLGYEAPWRRGDGSIIFLRENSRILRDETGRPLLHEGTLEDVTARRVAEDALRTSEEKYRDLFENASDLVQSVTMEGRYRYVNPTWLAKLGYSREEVDGLSMWDVVHPSHHEQCRELLGRLLRGEAVGPFETIFVAKDGHEVHLEGNVSCRVEQRDPIATRGIFRDITARRSAMTLLRLQGAALEEIANAVVIAGADGRILWVNPAFTRMTGYGADEAVGATPRILRSGEHPPEFYADLWATIQGGASWRGEVVNRHKDGHLYHERMVITPLADDRGTITHFVAIKEDVTERVRAVEQRLAHERALAEAEERFHDLLERSPDAVLVSDGDDRIVMANASAEALFGVPSDRLLGRVVRDLLPSCEVVASSPSRTEGEIRHADGGTVPVEIATARQERSDGTWTLRHISDLRPRLAADIAKREFVSMISHELRTPLTSVSASLALIAGDTLATLPAQLRPLVDVAVASSRRLLALIDDILDLDGLERGQMPLSLKEEDLVRLVDRALEANRGFARAHNVSLDLAEGPSSAPVRGDAGRLLQALASLLSNAAKFSPRGGRVSVRLLCPDRRVRIEVHNDGAPIPAHLRDRVFERFVQGDSSDSRPQGGSGLGLAIAKTIVEQHGGRIGLCPPRESGETFYIELPGLDREPTGPADRSEDQR